MKNVIKQARSGDINHWLNGKDMETGVHDATPVPAKVRAALLAEAEQTIPRVLAEILAPFKAEIDAMVCRWS